jgi:outer membrane biogenesis lipoprotein LolB
MSLYPANVLPATRTRAEVATRRLLGLLLAVLVVAACTRKAQPTKHKGYHPRRNTPSWAQREQALEVPQPR